ncbi:MAG: Asp-tRNA(Asn)/Glu-tRNA(Gln) amidotransferase subunit GatA [Acidipropionibacterium jensenii]|nr:Asp-tRNA(Asn)/Glu-tRNA(Gln) amidotransferase subunit GatA [Acidipropionibacterium jensenii]MDN5977057.1 Asp-tRNA(Asn)/Glu-tRNA(Gln) amidotransferase subunit GatA [Acidipropionibacterium jensenii]MDN5995792.1 Asp-tRNA(Asn)/Glu-tRNA(Gln) amidotransferase subunit GatA [Acidipropionibacterium jensenii]MDN6021165.1 Asp-tRNA(Asn)/Glu-tRNA(Gln) amidotransferase subunit GatA [Acidipropionibacterium jensenii]MDN6441359.1 Asp-tRNA(Asn)/Glu-tRNA(Gln) amidotransferase subunit GatA [Acidipropionibacteriu
MSETGMTSAVTTGDAEILTASACDLVAAMEAGELSSAQITRACLDRIEQVDGQVNAFLAVDADRAMDQAEGIDRRRAAGEKLGPLAGVPLAVKDLFCYRGMATTAGSRILEDWISPYTSTVVQRCLDAGMVVLGKTNLDEFAMGSSTETSAFGPTHNPWALDRIPGGSGGGSAAALAAFEAPLALGTDTGGSIRLPASVTGTVGVKPTYGGTSRYGVIAMASSLDQPGPCARTVTDAALLHRVIAGHDPMDQTSIPRDVPPVVEAARGADLSGMRLGVVAELSGDGYAPGVSQRFGEAVAALQEAGAEIVEISCPHFKHALGAYYLIQPAEVSSNLARYDAMRYGLRLDDDGNHSAEQVMTISRGAGFGAEAKRRIILGTYALSSGYYDAYYGSAQKVRTLIARDFEHAWDSCDALISPTTPTTAFRIGERTNDPLAMYQADLCTIPANLAGLAAGSFPAGLAPEDGLPVGLQVMAPVLADDRVYRVGGALEKQMTAAWGAPVLAQIPPLSGAHETEGLR